MIGMPLYRLSEDTDSMLVVTLWVCDEALDDITY